MPFLDPYFNIKNKNAPFKGLLLSTFAFKHIFS